MKFENTKAFMDSLTDWVIPGNTVRIYHRNKEVFSYSSGYSSLEDGQKMRGDELFNIYSCSKITTVVCALQLYEKGLLFLDAPLSDYISDYKTMYLKDGTAAKNEITLRHLFTHTSGLSYNVKSESVTELVERTDNRYTALEFAKAIARMPLDFEPGDRWAYSLAHDVLGAVIELVSGKRLSEYARENVFSPLGISASYQINDELKGRMAEQYMLRTDNFDLVKNQAKSTSDGRVENVGKERKTQTSPNCDSGGAGIITDASSYVKLANALAMRGVGHNGERILNEKTVDLLKTNALTDAQRAYLRWPQLSGYGYGLGVRTLIDNAAAGFSGTSCEFGWGGAAGSSVYCDTENGISAFYAHHMLNPQEDYYQPRLRKAIYDDFKSNM